VRLSWGRVTSSAAATRATPRVVLQPKHPSMRVNRSSSIAPATAVALGAQRSARISDAPIGLCFHLHRDKGALQRSLLPVYRTGRNVRAVHLADGSERLRKEVIVGMYASR
jgi:hypothetical protein